MRSDWFLDQLIVLCAGNGLVFPTQDPLAELLLRSGRHGGPGGDEPFPHWSVGHVPSQI